MANNIVQLQNKNSENIYPIAGGTTQGAVTKAMLNEGVFEGPELVAPGSVNTVATANIQDEAITTAKIHDLAVTTDKVAGNAVTSDKIDFTTYDWTGGGGGVSLHAFGKIVTVTLNVVGFTNDPTIAASDADPFTVTTLPIAPKEVLRGPTNCMTSSNVNVPDIFFEVSTSGIFRLRNYSSSAKTIHRVFATFTFIAA